MKTLLFSALVLCFLVSCRTGNRQDFSPQANPESDFEFQIEKSGVIITAYTGESPEVVIPRYIQGRPVREIGERAFAPQNRERITSVRIPGTVTRIGEGAFRYNDLTSVVIPPGVTVIEGEAFLENRLTSVTLPKGLTRIETWAFRNNELVSLDLPRGLTGIGWGAFSSNKLERLVLPPGLKHIDYEAFYQNHISSITIPESVVSAGLRVFGENPLTSLTIESRKPLFTEGVFHHNLPEFLPRGTYDKGEDETWFRREKDGSLLDFPSYYQKLAEKDPALLPYLVYAAIERENAAILRRLISLKPGLGSLVYTKFRSRAENPLAQLMRRWSFHDPRRSIYYNEINEEIAALLLEEGAVPEYWMLACSVLQRSLTKMLLEYGALENRPAQGSRLDPGSRPEGFHNPPFLLIYYVERLSNSEEENLRIVETAAELLAYGVDPGCQDPETRKTPLVINLQRSSYYCPEMTTLLLESLPRPLSLKEYRLLAGFNKKGSYYPGQEEVDPDYGDTLGYDALILEDVKKGLLDPLKKDDRGQDLFDWAAETGTAGLMEALMPALKKSGRVILAPDGAGLYAKAVKAKNYKTAALLYAEAPHRFIAKDSGGNEYSLEYYFYEYDAIHRRAQEIDNRSLYESGPGGTKRVHGFQTELRYEPNALYIAFSYYEGSTLRRVDGSSLDINALVNAERNRYYAAAGKEKPNSGDLGWHVSRIFGDVLFLYNQVYYWDDKSEQEYALLNIGKGGPSAYVLEAGPLEISAQTALYEPYTWISLMHGAMDFVISGDRAFLVKGGGEVMVFIAQNRSLVWEKTISYRECRIPGWQGGRRVFAAGDSAEAWDFAAGTGTVLGKRLEIPHYHVEGRNYLYEDDAGRRFIAEAETGRAFPEPEEPWHNFALFDRGYIYIDEQEDVHTVCIFQDGKLKRKLKFSGNAVDHSFSVYGNKIYVGMYGLAFTLNLDTAQVDRAFYSPDPGGNTEIYVYMFPFGNSDIVYTYIIDYGK